MILYTGYPGIRWGYTSTDPTLDLVSDFPIDAFSGL